MTCSYSHSLCLEATDLRSVGIPRAGEITSYGSRKSYWIYGKRGDSRYRSLEYHTAKQFVVSPNWAVVRGFFCGHRNLECC